MLYHLPSDRAPGFTVCQCIVLSGDVVSFAIRPGTRALLGIPVEIVCEQTDGSLMKVESIAECSRWKPNEGRKYCRMLPLEHSAILLTCIKPYSVLITKFWSF